MLTSASGPQGHQVWSEESGHVLITPCTFYSWTESSFKIRNHSRAAVPGLMIVSGVNFTFSCFVHKHRFCFLRVWCSTDFASSGHPVLLKFGLQDTLSLKVLKNVQHWQPYHCLDTGKYSSHTRSTLEDGMQLPKWQGNWEQSFIMHTICPLKKGCTTSIKRETQKKKVISQRPISYFKTHQETHLTLSLKHSQKPISHINTDRDPSATLKHSQRSTFFLFGGRGGGFSEWL